MRGDRRETARRGGHRSRLANRSIAVFSALNMIRPKENPNFVSHREAEQTLLAAATGNRCPHAWLITGPKGVGKATLAHRFARFLLAHPAGETPAPGLFGDALPASAPQTLALDVDDPVFRRAVAGGHTDLKILDEDAVTGRSGQIPVEAVRSVAPFLRQTAGEGGRRVVVIDCLLYTSPSPRD